MQKQYDTKTNHLSECSSYNSLFSPFLFCSSFSTWIRVFSDLNPSTTYTVSFYGRVGNSLYTNEKLFNYKTIDIVEGRNSVFATTKDTLDRTDINQYNTTNSGWSIFKNLKVEDSPNYFEDVMIEEGNVATEYEPYLENNTSVVIPRGSSGNRVYTANWEAV